MADYTLTATPPLAGVDRSFGDLSLKAPADLALVSIALPLGAEDKVLKAIKTAYGAELPDAGKSVLSKDGTVRLVRLGADQAMVIFTHATPDAEPTVQAKLKGTAYTTDQTDVWVGLELSGPTSRDALHRICPLDIHPDAFAVNDSARTVMEHLGTLLIRTGDDTYLLLSASSSAKSFLHAMETSAQNIS
ncbi:Sarcosine oxidase, gamma subunit family [Roseovarius albus]|uniref:Sarcosine oxidase, gamma subunit family n=1 Tax=Roseovarius albus TaxID=1247867 RepID=A0A1X6ZP00_9RHOB|nr:sarcosine oxidase subunit gamma family protein [Roseovarius albus]SLN56880.1 Sarcosine oxidase, gamma subunit family [Roseovarius albus]